MPEKETDTKDQDINSGSSDSVEEQEVKIREVESAKIANVLRTEKVKIVIENVVIIGDLVFNNEELDNELMTGITLR